MQELYADKDKKINELQQQIDDLKTMVQTLSKQGGHNTTDFSSSAFLKQNVPNPSGSNTIISYVLPGSASNAQILITDMKGVVLKKYPASKEGQVIVNTAEFPAGAYNYSLYINNKKIDTKTMVITK